MSGADANSSDDHFIARYEFIAELAKCLHEAGTTAPRLEEALGRVSRKLKLSTDVWSSPTAIILSFREFSPDRYPRELTRVMRLQPGDIDLRRLCAVDAIAEQVSRGELDPAQGMAALHAATFPASTQRRLFQDLVGYGLTAAGVSGLLKGGQGDVIAATIVGVALGLFAFGAFGRKRFTAGVEAMSALIASVLAGLISLYVMPINTQLVTLAGLIVLVPGLSLTSATMELATGHLVSGSARLAGAVATLLKLTFGAIVGTRLLDLLLHEHVLSTTQTPLADWVRWPALLLAAISFPLLFKARFRHYPICIIAAIVGFLTTQWGSEKYGPEFGVFLAGFVVTLLSNLFSRITNLPGAVVRLPGIILLVPGSVGFKTLSFVFEKDVYLGMDTAFSLVIKLVCLAAGLLFASTLIAPRRAL
jgi:uncharacterized membrane protein YjjP (DUF1212 family)